MTEHAPPPDAPTAQHVASGLDRIAHVLKNTHWKQANTHNLSPTQHQILSHLNRQGDRPTNLNDLARELGVTPATTSDAVRVLQAKGLLDKHRDPQNARSLVLVATLTGRDVANRAAGPPDFLVEAVQQLAPAAQLGLLQSLMHVIYQLQRQGSLPTARICPTCRYFRPYLHPGAEQPHHCAYVDAPFGDTALRLDCAEHEAATQDVAQHVWAELHQTWHP